MFGHDEHTTTQTQDVTQPVADATVLPAPDAQVLGAPVTTPTSSDMGGFEPTPVTTPVATAALDAASNDDALLAIKQQALQQLSPLLGHLEQTPEEKFRTTMMLIQASDNDALIKAAYDAALSIEDEKVRAQALLDIVNEINYFTHQQPAGS